jgi:hypothetical protein
MSKIDELRVKYSNLKPDSFNRLVNGDKTPTKKYAEFLLKTWSNRANNGCVRTIDNLIDLVSRFDTHLPYIIEKDIYHKSYLNVIVLKNVVTVAEEEKDAKSFDRSDHIEVLYEDDDVLFVIPKTHRGSLKYGSNTKWCTASRNNSAIFNNYTKNSLLAYLIDKTDKTTIQYRKLAFHSNWSNGGITNNIDIYNTSDNTCQDKSIISGGWSDEVLLKMMTIYRVKFINHKKIKDSIDAVNTFGNTLKKLNFDLLKDSLEKLEQSVEPSYISNLKENIDDFLKKLNTKQYGFTTTEN